MRRDIHFYFQQAIHRKSQADCPSIRFLSDDDTQAGFLVQMDPGQVDTISDVEYRCSTCITLVAICEHIAQEWRGSTVVRAKTLTVERILEEHPEVPPSRHSRAYLAMAAAQAALENLSL
jgi:NifU-like protein involved in Fe-S cluster formation